MSFQRLSPLPSVKDDGQRMPLPMSISRQLSQQGFPRHFGVRTYTGPTREGQQVVAVDDDMHGDEKPYARPQVLSTDPQTPFKTLAPLDNLRDI